MAPTLKRGPVGAVLRGPAHPYTRALLSAVPVPDPAGGRAVIHLEGELPSPSQPPRGCHFHPRCPEARDLCRESYPETVGVGTGHRVACHLHPPS